jgi:hypothetical protein
MSAETIAYPSAMEFVARAIVFGLLVVAAIAAIVLAGAWWTACIAAAGLLLAIAGFVVSVLGLFGDQRAMTRRASRSTALALAALSIVTIVAALIAA